MRRRYLIPFLGLAACGGTGTGTGGPTGDSGADVMQDLASAAGMGDLANQPAPMDMAMAMPADLRMAALDMATLAAYPPGPYGSNVGDTIAPLVWEGYVNPTAMGLASKQPYGTFTMDELRQSGNKFAMLYAADYW